MKLPSFRHFQDQFLTTNNLKEKWGKKTGPVFRNVCVFDVSRAVGIARFESVSESQRAASHDTMPLWSAENAGKIRNKFRCKSRTS